MATIRSEKVRAGFYNVWDSETLVATIEKDLGEWYITYFCEDGSVYDQDIWPTKRDCMERAIRWGNLEDAIVTESGDVIPARKVTIGDRPPRWFRN